MRIREPKLAAVLNSEEGYEAGLHFKHKKCGESAYPILVLDDGEIHWECLEHGFVEARSVARK